jgi:hypothetical protein
MIVQTVCIECRAILPIELEIIIDGILVDRVMGENSAYLCNQCLDDIENDI